MTRKIKESEMLAEGICKKFYGGHSCVNVEHIARDLGVNVRYENLEQANDATEPAQALFGRFEPRKVVNPQSVVKGSLSYNSRRMVIAYHLALGVCGCKEVDIQTAADFNIGKDRSYGDIPETLHFAICLLTPAELLKDLVGQMGEKPDVDGLAWTLGINRDLLLERLEELELVS